MYQENIVKGFTDKQKGSIQVACKNCFMAQEIPEPPKKENLTVWKCAFCEQVQTLHHNLADWRVANFWANVLLVVVILLCAAFVLGSVWWWSWVYL